MKIGDIVETSEGLKRVVDIGSGCGAECLDYVVYEPYEPKPTKTKLKTKKENS